MTRQEYRDIYDVVGVAMEVYNTLGRCLAEPIYQEAFLMEARLRGMDVEREKKLSLTYKGMLMEKTYFADFFYKDILIELKSVSELLQEHRAQLLNYLRITHLDRGILFNFGETNLHTERYLYLSEIDEFVLLTHDNYQEYIIP
ncbi:MAG: GxxExxY protein [Bacteroidaceae bacterium]|nr:GxxExxY protein [Bacteroidaceae bacterium]